MLVEDNLQKQRAEKQKTVDNIAELKRLRKIHQLEREQFREKLNLKIKENQERVEKFKTQMMEA